MTQSIESLKVTDGAADRSLSQSALPGTQLTHSDSRFLCDQRKAQAVPSGFAAGSVSEHEIVFDYAPLKTGPHSYSLGLDMESSVPPRSLGDKLNDFVHAAAARATDPQGWKQYLNAQSEKALGIGDGLNAAKEETKKAGARAITSVLDGSALNAIMHPQPLLQRTGRMAQQALSAMAEDPNAVNKLISTLADVTVKASESYSHKSARQQGKVIGEVMFGMVNPEGSTQAAESALNIADQVVTHVDGAVVDAIQKAMQATKEMAQNAPELAQQSKQMLYDYTRKLGLSGPELEYAGVPKGYFDDLSQATAQGKPDYFYAASRRDRANDWAAELTREVPSSREEAVAFRGDHDFESPFNAKGKRKAHLNPDGDLVPADPAGMYKGRKVSIAEHIDAQSCWRAKEHSPYICFGTTDGVVAKYGGRAIELDLQGLRNAIAAGDLKGVKLFEHEEVVEKIRNSYFNRYRKIELLEYVAKDKEIIVEGIILKRFLTIRPTGN